MPDVDKIQLKVKSDALNVVEVLKAMHWT
jgi:hypothetical protein